MPFVQQTTSLCSHNLLSADLMLKKSAQLGVAIVTQLNHYILACYIVCTYLKAVYKALKYIYIVIVQGLGVIVMQPMCVIFTGMYLY